jgi:hypothetical protein
MLQNNVLPVLFHGIEHFFFRLKVQSPENDESVKRDSFTDCWKWIGADPRQLNYLIL